LGICVFPHSHAKDVIEHTGSAVITIAAERAAPAILFPNFPLQTISVLPPSGISFFFSGLFRLPRLLKLF
jgi:hypothetical protein